MALSLAAGILAALILAAFRRPRLLRPACRWLAGGAARGGPRGPFPGRPRRVRAAWRTGGTLAALGVLWGLLFARTVTLVTLAAMGAAGAAWGAWSVIRWRRGLRHFREWTRPAHHAAAPIAGIDPDTDPRAWLTIAPDRSRVVALLPVAWTPDGGAQGRLVRVLAAKLALEAPRARWVLEGPAPRLELTQSPPLPEKVLLRDVREALERAKPDELVWGIGKHRAIVKTSLNADSPHMGLSMGSGGGKSETAKSLLAQMLHRGAIGLVLDHKMTSHPWTRGLPNVVEAVRVPEIHAYLVWLGAEITRRKEVAYAGIDMYGNIHADVGPRLIIVLEELNSTAPLLRGHWRAIRGRDDPPRSPALAALDEASFTGRSVLVNLIYVGQRLSDKATGGGGDARENIGVIAFARYRPSTWKMLAGDFAMPPKSRVLGRMQVVSDRVRECQGVLMSTDEAREYALSGVVSPLPSGLRGARTETGETGTAVKQETGPDLRSETGLAALEAGPVSRLVTLREAVMAGIVPGLTVAGARTARHRDPAFPASRGREGTTDLYDPAELAEWAAGRK